MYSFTSGQWTLAFFLIAHVSAVLFGRVVLGLDTNFYFAAAGFHGPMFPFFFAPFYFMGLVALFTHIGCAAYWQSQGRPHAVRTFLLVGPIVAGGAVALLIVLMLAGMVFPVEIPAQYKATYIPGNR